MFLRFVFLLITRTASWLQLSWRQETWRITEILILRHQLAVLQRRQPRRPKLNWADRPLLAILLGAIPNAHQRWRPLLDLLVAASLLSGYTARLNCGSRRRSPVVTGWLAL